MRVAIYTLGCKVNQYETQAMEQELTRRGHTLVPFEDTADAYIINTCSVTAVSDKKSRQMIRRAKGRNPGAVVAACGCYVQTHTDEAESLGIDLVGGTGERMKFLDLLEQAAADRRARVLVDEALRRRDFEVLPAGGQARRTRAMLKVEDGCVNFCTYCIIPYARGPVRSLPLEQAVAQTRRLREEGYREIVFTGIEISSWGHDFKDGSSLIDLLEAVSAAAGDMRLRLGSLEPRTITEDFCRRAARLPNLCEQFHLSLQSGCDETLRRMNRRYTAEHYKSLIADARKKMPDITLSSDIIVGFPGETDEDFEQTLRLVQDTRFDLLFTFLYSPRTGTPAASYEDNASPQDKQRRFERLLKTQDDIVAEKQAAYQGKTLRLLVDGAAKGPDYPYTARTEGNLLVCVRGENIQIGEFIQAEIEKTSLRCLFAVKKS